MSYKANDADILLRKPKPEEGLEVYRLIANSPPLDLNSVYNYYLLTTHFADTCVVAEHMGRVTGFLSAYIRPDAPNVLFIWQVAVDASMRGKGVARMMLSSVMSRPECAGVEFIETTVGPSNAPSRGLFESFSKKWNYPLDVSEFLPASAFGELEHESEELLRIGPVTTLAKNQ